MPIINSNYRAPKFMLRNGHIETILPRFFRKVPKVNYQREKIDTPDNDFLNLDWARSSNKGSKRLAILSHGLEGSSDSVYMKGMIHALKALDWDALAWNYRGCGGELNRQKRSYHSGATEDLQTVVAHVLSLDQYDEIVLFGFSLGGNLSLKYAGEQGSNLSKQIKKVIVFSTPCDLAAASEHLTKGFNQVYTNRFLDTLIVKAQKKAQHFPDIDVSKIHEIKDLSDYDDMFTAPIHGFKDAADYYEKCSSGQFIPAITVPTLIVNALNDPFFPMASYPIVATQNHPNVWLEMPKHGGHVGFFSAGKYYWSEQRTVQFLRET